MPPPAPPPALRKPAPSYQLPPGLRPVGATGATPPRAGSPGRGPSLVVVLLLGLLVVGGGYLVMRTSSSSTSPTSASSTGPSPTGKAPTGKTPTSTSPAGRTGTTGPAVEAVPAPDAADGPGVAACFGSKQAGQPQLCMTGASTTAPGADCSRTEVKIGSQSLQNVTWSCRTRPASSIDCNSENDFCMWITPGAPLPSDVDSNGRSLTHGKNAGR